MGNEEVTDLVVSEIEKFELTVQTLEGMKEEYMPLAVKGIEDVAGYKKVKECRILVKSTRVKVEKIGAELRRNKRKEIEDYIDKVFETEKFILGYLNPIEKHLSSQQKAVDDEKARIKKEAEDREAARIEARFSLLRELGAKFDEVKYSVGDDLFMFAIDVRACSDERFNDFLERIKEKNAELKRIEDARLKQIAEEAAAKEKARMEEEARIADENRKLIIKQKIMALREINVGFSSSAAEIESYIKKYETTLVENVFDEFISEARAATNETVAKLYDLLAVAIAREEIEAEKVKMESEKQARQEEKDREEAEKKRKQEIEETKKRAAEQARINAEAEIKRQAEERERLEQEAKDRAAREEELRPDREKLLIFASAIEMLPAPEIKSDAARQILNKTEIDLAAAVRRLRKNVKEFLESES